MPQKSELQTQPEPRPHPWDTRPRPAGADELFTPPSRPQPAQALDGLAAKIGSVLLLLAISGVAAVGILLPDEETAPAGANAPDAPQRAYALAYEMARQRVTGVEELTRKERLATGRAAVAQIMGADINAMSAEEITARARQAPEPVKQAAFRGLKKGEAMAISAQSLRLIEHLLRREQEAANSPRP